MKCFYFGCGDSVGHSLWTTEGKSVWGDDALPFQWTKLDGGFIGEGLKYKQGHATLTVVDGWTVLAFADNSIDSRPNSNSAYAIEGVFNFAEACKIAEEKFPYQWNRPSFTVIDKT